MLTKEESTVSEATELEDHTVQSAISVPPSVSHHLSSLYSGSSYVHYTPVPELVNTNRSTQGDDKSSLAGTPVVLGVDEAGRGPVIGPMVYGIFYLPIEIQHTLLADKYHFDDSKVLTPVVRARLMRALCTTGTDLYRSCGWAIKSLSAQDISNGMLRNGGSYNLNAQAMDATIEVIRGVIDQGLNVKEVYIDTIGKPEIYQKKLELIFPTISITVAKKADSLYPCVSAASVVAKVTRDVSCESLYSEVSTDRAVEDLEEIGWGSGYPGDARCVAWMKNNIDGTFGWGPECRFGWSTVKDLLEAKNSDVLRVDWPDDDSANGLSQYFGTNGMNGVKSEAAEYRSWYGQSTSQLF